MLHFTISDLEKRCSEITPERGSIKTIIFSNFETLVELRNRGFSFETITKALNESANLELKSGTVRKNFNRAKEYFSNPENIQIKQNLEISKPVEQTVSSSKPEVRAESISNFGNGLFEEGKQTETRQQVSKVSASKPIQPEVKQVQPKPVESNSDQTRNPDVQARTQSEPTRKPASNPSQQKPVVHIVDAEEQMRAARAKLQNADQPSKPAKPSAKKPDQKMPLGLPSKNLM